MTRFVLALFALLAALVAVPHSLDAYVCNATTSTCMAIVTFTEPSTCVGGTPLNSGTTCPALQDDVITWIVDGATTTTLTVAASVPGGGGTRSSGGATPAFTAPQVNVPICTKKTFNASIVARTVGGGISSSVSATPITFDRTAEPSCNQPNPPTTINLQ